MDSIVRAFFDSKVFSRCERHVLKIALLQKEPDFTLEPFRVGDSIYMWRVAKRNDHEILLEWNTFGMSGSTWFFKPPNRSCDIVFGSTLARPDWAPDVGKRKKEFKDKKSKKDGDKKSSSFTPQSIRAVANQTGRIVADDSLSPMSKFKGVLVNLALLASLPIHRYYSRILLLSTRKYLSGVF